MTKVTKPVMLIGKMLHDIVINEPLQNLLVNKTYNFKYLKFSILYEYFTCALKNH